MSGPFSQYNVHPGEPMRLSSAIRAMLITLTLTVGFGTVAYADGGRIRFNVVKAGFVIGGSGGSGTLLFHGRYYPLAVGGVSYGFTFGALGDRFLRDGQQHPLAVRC